ncbi:hypothetical protein [Flavobacterium luteum]|uniref:Uncharacterized protein n=1 Tax=Flavobacterium luteum TaxID=2026654 RepID=A0A7J5ABS2_9FLAO|nr:hypothetical protein [Flavobacterium luteum]KAB1155006.1 hypothetical protein F6464_11325 [Flavobacterium luteum]
MNKSSKKYQEKIDFNKVDEPSIEYNLEDKISDDSQLNPILVQLIEKSKKNHQEGNVFSHEEAMKKIKLKYHL